MTTINKHNCTIVIIAVALTMLLTSAATASDETLSNVQILARIAEGEAEVLGREGMLAVMWTARNRVEDARFPDDYEAVSKAFYGRKRGAAKPEIVKLSLEFLVKEQGDDPTGGAVYAYGLADVRWLALPPADHVVPDEPVAGRWQLHLYGSIDWVAWREAREEQQRGKRRVGDGAKAAQG